MERLSPAKRYFMRGPCRQMGAFPRQIPVLALYRSTPSRILYFMVYLEKLKRFSGIWRRRLCCQHRTLLRMTFILQKTPDTDEPTDEKYIIPLRRRPFTKGDPALVSNRKMFRKGTQESYASRKSSEVTTPKISCSTGINSLIYI